MKKRILIDATTISAKTDGLTQYIINLLKNFPEVAFQKYDISLLVNSKIQNPEFNKLIDKKKFKIFDRNISPIGPLRDLGFFFFLLTHKNKFDVFHSTSNQYPLGLKKGIATVHDITFETYFRQKWWTFNLAKFYLSFILKQSLKNAKLVVAVSNHTKDVLTSKYKLPKFTSEKINVIHEGWEHLQIEKLESYSNPYFNEYGNYFFYVGTTKEHKNIIGLLEGYQIAIKNINDINLVLCGCENYLSSEEIAIVSQINKIKKKVFLLGYVSDEKLRHLFNYSKAFIFPSLSEGFGIPILETFFYKKPLLCSNTTSLPEIAGDAALYFDPESAEDISRAMIHFYDNPELAGILITKGNNRLKDFSWTKAARETVCVYDMYFEKQLSKSISLNDVLL